jgi:hypothetical protein
MEDAVRLKVQKPCPPLTFRMAEDLGIRKIATATLPPTLTEAPLLEGKRRAAMELFSEQTGKKPGPFAGWVGS